MSTLTEQDIKKIAHLARLDISTAEIAAHTENISKILDFVEQINQVATDDIEPTAHALDGFQYLRPDEVIEIPNRDLLQHTAPKTEAGLYLVPRVIEECDIEVRDHAQ